MSSALFKKSTTNYLKKYIYISNMYMHEQVFELNNQQGLIYY